MLSRATVLSMAVLRSSPLAPLFGEAYTRPRIQPNAAAGRVGVNGRPAAHLNAKPLRAVDDWLRDYQAFWSESLRNLKRFVEEDR